MGIELEVGIGKMAIVRSFVVLIALAVHVLAARAPGVIKGQYQIEAPDSIVHFPKGLYILAIDASWVPSKSDQCKSGVILGPLKIDSLFYIDSTHVKASPRKLKDVRINSVELLNALALVKTTRFGKLAPWADPADTLHWYEEQHRWLRDPSFADFYFLRCDSLLSVGRLDSIFGAIKGLVSHGAPSIPIRDTGILEPAVDSSK